MEIWEGYRSDYLGPEGGTEVRVIPQSPESHRVLDH